MKSLAGQWLAVPLRRTPIHRPPNRRPQNRRRDHSSRVRPPTPASSGVKAWAVGTLVTLILAPIAFRLTDLQLVQGEVLRRSADQNRVRTVPQPPARGELLDRRGERLATTRLARAAYAVPARLTLPAWQTRLTVLASALDRPVNEILTEISTALAQGKGDRPIQLARDLSPAAYTHLAEQDALGDRPDVFVRTEPLRLYPQGPLAAHVLGSVGMASPADHRRWPQLPVGAIVGQAGVERLAETQLQGQWGGELVESDARGRVTRLLGQRPTEDGQSVRLTLDMVIQRAAETALGDRRGAVVALDVNTGEVLAIASRPGFDPNWFAGRLSRDRWQQLNGPDKPLLDRARTAYPPGSTFKIVTAIAGMQSGRFPPGTILSTAASLTYGGTQFGEHGGSGYGAIGYAKALAVSSNTFFYQVGFGVGPEAIARWGHALGIGHPAARLGLPGGANGQIPTPADKKQRYGSPWYIGDTISSAIGQGLVLATPVELATMVAAIANGGFRLTPHLLIDQTGKPETRPEGLGLTEPELAVLREGLTGAVQAGTAKVLNDPKLPPSAGKTGTAEVPHGPSNAMFVGYAPRDRPQIAVAVAVENGGYGGETAAPIAKAVFQAYFR